MKSTATILILIFTSTFRQPASAADWSRVAFETPPYSTSSIAVDPAGAVLVSGLAVQEDDPDTTEPALWYCPPGEAIASRCEFDLTKLQANWSWSESINALVSTPDGFLAATSSGIWEINVSAPDVLSRCLFEWRWDGSSLLTYQPDTNLLSWVVLSYGSFSGYHWMPLDDPSQHKFLKWSSATVDVYRVLNTASETPEVVGYKDRRGFWASSLPEGLFGTLYHHQHTDQDSAMTKGAPYLDPQDRYISASRITPLGESVFMRDSGGDLYVHPAGGDRFYPVAGAPSGVAVIAGDVSSSVFAASARPGGPETPMALYLAEIDALVSGDLRLAVESCTGSVLTLSAHAMPGTYVLQSSSSLADWEVHSAVEIGASCRVTIQLPFAGGSKQDFFRLVAN